MRMLPLEWQPIRRILAIHDSPSESVAIGPALRAIQQALPLATITLMTLDADRQLASLTPWSDDAISSAELADELDLAPASMQQLIRLVRQRQFDAAIVFTLCAQSPYPAAYIAYLAGIPIRVGQSQEFGGGVLSHWVKPCPDQVSLSDRHLFLLQSIGFPVTKGPLEVPLPRRAQDGVYPVGDTTRQRLAEI